MSDMNKINSEEKSPSIDVLFQYIKDFSFENPSPLLFLEKKGGLDTKVGIDVNHFKYGDSNSKYEVVLSIKIDVSQNGESVYIAEVHYAGIFEITNANDELRTIFLFIECPRLLFPYARSIISRITQESGFPSLDLKPVDFTQVAAHKIKTIMEQQGKNNQYDDSDENDN